MSRTRPEFAVVTSFPSDCENSCCEGVELCGVPPSAISGLIPRLSHAFALCSQVPWHPEALTFCLQSDCTNGRAIVLAVLLTEESRTASNCLHCQSDSQSIFGPRHPVLGSFPRLVTITRLSQSALFIVHRSLLADKACTWEELLCSQATDGVLDCLSPCTTTIGLV